MGNKIKIKVGTIEMEAELNNSKTAKLIWDALPITASCNTWGDEIYFYISIKAGLEDPKELVEPGELGYWPEGPALCIFFGPTPISKGKEIRPASAVNIIGKLTGEPKEFKKVSKDISYGALIQIERATSPFAKALGDSSPKL